MNTKYYKTKEEADEAFNHAYLQALEFICFGMQKEIIEDKCEVRRMEPYVLKEDENYYVHIEFWYKERFPPA